MRTEESEHAHTMSPESRVQRSQMTQGCSTACTHCPSAHTRRKLSSPPDTMRPETPQPPQPQVMAESRTIMNNVGYSPPGVVQRPKMSERPHLYGGVVRGRNDADIGQLGDSPHAIVVTTQCIAADALTRPQLECRVRRTAHKSPAGQHRSAQDRALVSRKNRCARATLPDPQGSALGNQQARTVTN
eukprot:scaffold2580_cov388-Prasinococcus_capsulatus_cf.AAC.8